MSCEMISEKPRFTGPEYTDSPVQRDLSSSLEFCYRCKSVYFTIQFTRSEPLPLRGPVNQGSTVLNGVLTCREVI